MKCMYCNGMGYVHNEKVNSMSSYEAYVRDIPCRVKCKACGGIGFILSNADEVMNMIDIHINNKTSLTQRELKQLKIMLKK